ncbi:MAG: 2-octaprenyl-6-methoxyphenyl hydroxylase, partial [Alphaproteobacteria bacterium]
MNEPLLERAEVIVGGGGLAGLAFGVALRQALGPHARIVVADPAFAFPLRDDGRASAFAAAGRRLFETLGVWDEIAPDAQPILDMVVTDSRASDVVRPVYLSFAGEVSPGEPFAHMIPNVSVLRALEARARVLGVELRATGVARFVAESARTRVTFADGAELAASLLV